MMTMMTQGVPKDRHAKKAEHKECTNTRFNITVHFMKATLILFSLIIA